MQMAGQKKQTTWWNRSSTSTYCRWLHRHHTPQPAATIGSYQIASVQKQTCSQAHQASMNGNTGGLASESTNAYLSSGYSNRLMTGSCWVQAGLSPIEVSIVEPPTARSLKHMFLLHTCTVQQTPCGHHVAPTSSVDHAAVTEGSGVPSSWRRLCSTCQSSQRRCFFSFCTVMSAWCCVWWIRARALLSSVMGKDSITVLQFHFPRFRHQVLIKVGLFQKSILTLLYPVNNQVSAQVSTV